METITIKCQAQREVYSNGDFRIVSFVPMNTEDCRDVKLDLKYLTFTCKGSNFPYITIGKTYTLEIEEAPRDGYGRTSYKIISCPSLDSLDLKNLTNDEAFEILMDCTSSERIANNILSAYPNFIELIMTQGKDAIDTNKIVGVGSAYLNAYSRELLSKYKYYHILKKYNMYAVDVEDCKKLLDKYIKEEDIEKAFNDNPYYVLTDVLGRGFEYSDRIILEAREDLLESYIRCEALIISVLRRNENDGNTRLSGRDLYYYVKEDYNVPYFNARLKDVAVNSDYIYFDEKSNDLSVMSTYLGECMVADFVKEKLENSHKLDIDWKKYKNVDGFEMSETQMGCLKNFCEHDISLLVGYAGCVDAETEYFNGEEWKSIADYKHGEKVLQWNKDGSANLVEPIDYISKPCDKMYHFETKYGLNQTLSAEHRVVYKTQKGKLREDTMENIAYNHKNGFLGFNGKFMTTFSYDGKGIDLTDNEIKLMCAVICDGTFYSNVNPNNDSYNRCRFHIKKDRKKDELRRLFNESNIWWREKESSAKGYTDFYINAPRREKEFTSYWYNCSQHQLQLICDNILQWDGYISVTKNGVEQKSFSTGVKRTADFVQFAFSSCGYRTTISIDDRRGRVKKDKKTGKEYVTKSIFYDLKMTKRILCGLCRDRDNIDNKRTKIVEVVPKNNMKYCFTVDSSYLVLRRNNKIFITGNSGKTTSVKGLVSLFEDNDLSYCLVSPTGKASKRLTESTNRKSSTIHRKVLSGDEIYVDALVIDEGSMTDLQTLLMLIKSITNPHCKIVIVGDNAQLLPVSYGNPFNDIIDSKIVPITMLTEIFRYKSNGSLYVATNVRQGKEFLSNKDDMVRKDGNITTVGDNYKFIQTDDIFDVLIKEYMTLINKGVKPKDILCLSAFNVGDDGSYRINNEIQAEINPPKPKEVILDREIGDINIKFRVGDRVLNKKNDYSAIPLDSWELLSNDSDKILTESDVLTTNIFNGQDGAIRDVDEDKMIVQFDEELIVIPKQKLNTMLLSYAISVHSSQGSESKYVINVISPKHKKMLNRNLLYVADTRSKYKHIDIGDLNTYNQALLIDGNEERNTWLCDLLTSPHTD